MMPGDIVGTYQYFLRINCPIFKTEVGQDGKVAGCINTNIRNGSQKAGVANHRQGCRKGDRTQKGLALKGKLINSRSKKSPLKASCQFFLIFGSD
jgi:hypothetical protein